MGVIVCIDYVFIVFSITNGNVIFFCILKEVTIKFYSTMSKTINEIVRLLILSHLTRYFIEHIMGFLGSFTLFHKEESFISELFSSKF
ncbi:MAG: hypothetical protein ACI9YB_002972 [Halioglobus sp.]|jgi:hypothetical protein